MKNQKKAAAPVLEPQPLAVVLRSLGRQQERALIYEYLAAHAADAFRGTDARPPTKLLALPDGSKHRAEVPNVLEIEDELRRLASDARGALAELLGAGVLVDPAVVRLNPAHADPFVPTPDNEGVEANASSAPRGRSEAPR